MKTIIGTNHFVSEDRAMDYYLAYGITARFVRHKIKSGEIHIGKPELKQGQTLLINREEGRYFIQEN